MHTTKHIWLLSPYHTGSHRAWARGLARHSRHEITLLTMAGRFWKWRMQGGAVELAAQARDLLARAPAPDLVLATDMVNLPAWLALLRRDLPPGTPTVLYMHENQLTYPPRPGEKPNYTYATLNWLSQLAADAVVFNSDYHRRSWFGALPNLLKHFPDYNHLALVDAVRSASHILPVGIDAAALATDARDELSTAQAGGEVPLIVWNQRWEYDKRPADFFALLYKLREAGVAFELAVAGENFRNVPEEFEVARRELAEQIVHWGYVDSRAEYIALLQRASLVVSTAAHEFFGISVLEAVAAGAFPLLPNRLSYPELIPPALHPACLYADETDLRRKAVQRLRSPRPAPPSLRQHVVERYDWIAVAGAYDQFFEAVPRK